MALTNRDGAGRGSALVVLLVAAFLISMAGSVPAAGAQPFELLTQFCNGHGPPSSGGAGRCEVPWGIAADSATGDVYVVDSDSNRIMKFTAWGEFLRAWGWGVVASGPGNKPQNEIQKVTVDATGGNFAFSYAGRVSAEITSPISFDATVASVQSALEGLGGLSPGDVAVSGPAGGPWTIEFIGDFSDADVGQLNIVNSTLSGGGASATVTTIQGGANFEICIPADGDTCRAGQGGTIGGPIGSSRGELAFPAGVALSSDGDVYVVDRQNHRVQKFDSEGNFLLTFGGEVNTGTSGNPSICTNAGPPTDVCKAGSTGTGNGQFEAWPEGSFIAIGPGSPDTVYVGDKGRIQKFDASGTYQGQITLSEAGEVRSLAIDPASGDLYFAYASELAPFPSPECKQPNVHRLDPVTGNEVGTPLKVDCPGAIATGSDGSVYVFGKAVFITNGDSRNHGTRILQFNSGGAQTALFLQNVSVESTGIATSSACGINGNDLFVSNWEPANSFVRIYGPPPDIHICPPPKVKPQIEAQHALSVGTIGAVVRAQINPKFWSDTSYYVEYGTGKCFEGGCGKTALFPGSQLGAGVVKALITTKGVFLGAEEPLEPDTTYHYRFVAESKLNETGAAYGEDPDGEEGPEEASFEKGLEGTFHTFALPAPAKICPNQEFRTGASARLPDCRAYEMVSPLDKNNSDVSIPDEGHTMSAIDGDSLTFTVLAAAFGDPLSAPFAPQYLSRRDPEAGWLTHSINPPRKLPLLYSVPNSIDLEFRAFSEDLCSGWLIQYADVPLAPGAPQGVPNLYRRDNCAPGEGQYELITTVPPNEPAPPGPFSAEKEPADSFYFLAPQGSCNDGATTVFSAPARLTEEAANKDLRQVYASSNGQLHAVSVLPRGKVLDTHASTGTQQGGINEFTKASVYHAVAEDCSRIFWSAAASNKDPTRAIGVGGSGDLPGKIYVRINPLQPQSVLEPTLSKKCSEPEKACSLAISEAADARFLTADVKGKTAIYSTGGDLFEFDVDKAIAAIAGEPATTLIAHQVKGILGASDDATRIYLVSGEALDGGAVAGKSNLYLYERGVGFSFIGILSETDLLGNLPTPISLTPKSRAARVSPDGLHAAFTSSASLTGYDNTDANSGQADAEVFLYDATANAGAGQLLCASCNPSGSRPSGRDFPGANNSHSWAAARLPGWVSQLHPGNFLSTDGSRLFFESFEALIPRDTNGKQDVYEWERAANKEDCLSGIGGELFVPASEGCLSLISSGQSAEDAYLADASADGRDVFFATSASLLVQDFGLRDLYDARAGGGFPAPKEDEPECEGEACQGAAFTPEDPTPASSAFEGAGNVVEPHRPARCAKGKVRHKGRCVARKHKHAHKRHRAKRAEAKRRVSR